MPDSLLSTLRARLQELQRLDGTILVRERELRSARARLEQEKRLLGDAVREDRLPELGHEALDGLAEFARRAEAVRGERAAVEAQVRRLGPPASADAGEDLERIREQVRLLQRWLRTPGAAGADVAWLRSLVAAGAGLLLAAGFAGGALLSPLVVGLAVGGMLLLLAAWSRSRTRPAPRAAVQREHVAAGLEPPPRWTEREVEARLAALYRQQAEAVLAGERTGRREELEQSLHAIRARAAELDSERIEIAARVGVAPEVDEAKLFWLVERVSRWQAAASDVDAAAVELQAATAQRTRFLERASSDLLPLGAGRVEDAAELHGRIEALNGVRQQHAAAMAAREAAVEREATAVHRLEELQAGVREVFERLGLEPDDDATLDEWCRQREPYLEAENRVRAAEHERARTERALRQRPDFEPGLVKMALDDLERERTEREWTAGELPSLQEEIIRIETRLHDARSACDVEAAITHHGACLAALGEVREKDYARTVGAALADFLQQETRDRERPRVFHRARELFALITRGRYRLEVGHGDGAAFRALDTTTHVGYALEELSSATRVQLLFAVRVAFVETQEHGPRLPLLLDETLGNSDDQRAQAIIEAVLALCREGRQVFYFTAQPDEVGKWRAALEAHPEVPYRVVDLARARELRGTELPPLLLETSPPAPQVPTPDGAGYVEYGRRLGVPAFDPCIEDTSRIHLWHLLDCPDTLHRLLSLNVERWGQLRTLWEHGGGALLGDDAALYGRMDATARLLGEIARAWRVGRGRPVDRRALIDSGAITETFLERVCGLCAEVGGDGERLLAGLEAGEVARFRSDNIARLREYLETHGFVDREAPLTPEDIRVRALAAAAPDIEDGRLTPGDVERLLVKLPPHLQIRRAHPMRFG